MTEAAKRILAIFAESYPTSAHYKGGRPLRKGEWEAIFPAIATDVTAKEEFLDAVEELVAAKILSVRWKRFREHDEVEALYLDDPQALFAALGRQSPESIAAEMLARLGEPPWNDESTPGRLAAVAAYLRPRLEAGHPVPIASAGELADLGRLLALTAAETRALPIRALSVRLYRDSKRLERLLPIADRLGRAAGFGAVSEELGLTRSYPEVSFALFGRIVLGRNGEAWRTNGEVVTLPAESVDRICSVEIDSPSASPASPAGRTPPTVLSVENKESFRVMAERLARRAVPPVAGVIPNALVYTAGHPNGAVLAFLQLLKSAGASFLHFGDLDPDGILILQEMSAALGTTIQPFLMTAEVHRRFARYGYSLDAAQRARLELVRADASPDISALAREIERTRIGVEQEIIDLDAAGG